MNEADLLSRLKGTLLIPESVTKFDETLKVFLLGAREYIDSILDQPADKNSALYQLSILLYAQYMFLNRDNPKLKQLPVSLNALLNRLKDRTHN